VAPLPRPAPTAFSYWLVHLPEAAGSPGLAAFRSWLVAEAGAFREGRR
jgi:DNA-binding transcriptional LysR family regulator